MFRKWWITCASGYEPKLQSRAARLFRKFHEPCSCKLLLSKKRQEVFQRLSAHVTQFLGHCFDRRRCQTRSAQTRIDGSAFFVSTRSWPRFYEGERFHTQTKLQQTCFALAPGRVFMWGEILHPDKSFETVLSLWRERFHPGINLYF